MSIASRCVGVTMKKNSPMKEQRKKFHKLRAVNALGITNNVKSRDMAESLSEHLSPDLLYRLAVDKTSIVAVTDIAGKIIYANEMFCKISKYSQEELLGQDHRIVNSGVHPKAFFQNMRTTIHKGKIWQGDICNKAKDGSLYWVTSTIVPCFHADGRIKAFIAIRKVITKEKNKQLQLNKMIKDANEATIAKSEFLSMMGHEIRTPLNGIIGMVGPLLKTSLSSEQRECVETISRSSKILLNLLSDLLDFSKIESGKMDLARDEFDFSAYLDELVWPHYYSASNKGIVFKKEDNYFPNMLIGDSDRIGQIINNLVSNAIKFTGEGAVTLQTDYQTVEQETVVTLKVHDTGIGIPEEAKHRMFKAFSQAKICTAREYGGTGLGLSIAKKLVDLMNGSISFESDDLHGTTFTVVLQLPTGKKIVEKNRYVDRFRQMYEEITFSGRVLVAEDNNVNQLVISRILDDWECDHHIVASGNEVLDALRDNKYDLILMDCWMPELDGHETTKIIRKSQTLHATIPIVALTASATVAEKERCLSEGMNDYISKPIDIEKFQEILKRYLAWDLKHESKSKTISSHSPVSKLIDTEIIGRFALLPLQNGTDFLIDLITTFVTSSL